MNEEPNQTTEKLINSENVSVKSNKSRDRDSLTNPTKEDVEFLQTIRKLPWYRRLFRVMDTGSLRGVIVMWIRMTLGIGILTLPYYVKQYGGVIGVAIIVIAALVNFMAYVFIFDAAFTTNKKNYPDLIKELLGNRVLSVFKLTFILDITSTMMIYCIVSWNLLEYIIYFFGIGEQYWDEWIIDKDRLIFDEMHPTIFKIRGAFFYGIFLLTIPLFLKKNLEALQKVTIGYLFALFLLVGIILCEMPFFSKAYKDEDINFNYFKKPDFNWIECFFGLCISFYVQPFIFSLKGELLLPSRARTRKISSISVSIEAIIFIVLGFFGYFTLGDKYTPNLLILRKPYPNKNYYSELAFRFAIALFFLLNTLGLAMYNPSLRDYLDKYITMRNQRVKFILLSLLPFFIICTTSFLYPYIIDVTNFFGVTVYNFNGYLIPIMMKIAILKRNNASWWKMFIAYFFLLVFIAMGVSGLIFRCLGWVN